MLKLDNKDKNILKMLYGDGRASVSEISRKTGIPRDSVHYRLQRLIKSGVINQFLLILDSVKLGYPVFTFVNFILYNFDDKTEKEFYSYLVQQPYVIYVAKTTGKWDCTISISAKTLEHFDSILRDIRKKFSPIIKEFETASIIEEIKYDYKLDLIQ